MSRPEADPAAWRAWSQDAPESALEFFEAADEAGLEAHHVTPELMGKDELRFLRELISRALESGTKFTIIIEPEE